MTPEEVEKEVITHANRFRGRMAGLIESFGLPERQEKAAIATLKSLSYDEQKALQRLVNPNTEA